MNKYISFGIGVFLELVSTLIFIIFGMVYLFGGFNLEISEYGSLYYFFIFLFFLLLFIIPLLFYKIKRIYVCVAYLVVFIVFIGGVKFSYINLYEKYNEFSRTEWISKPVVRQVMYESLKNDEKFYLCNMVKIEQLLGNPNKKYSDSYVYDTIPGYIIINFKNGVVSEIYWDSPLG